MSTRRVTRVQQQIGQVSEWGCWEACARMMWNWKYGDTDTSHADYLKKIEVYSRVGTPIHPNNPITKSQAFAFYLVLGLRSLSKPKLENIKHALQWSPVIVFIKTEYKHALVIDGYSNGIFRTIDPKHSEAMQGDENGNIKKVWVAGRKGKKEKDVTDSYFIDYIYYW